jgi:alginate O-acetyltransferase complex protein AlgI
MPAAWSVGPPERFDVPVFQSASLVGSGIALNSFTFFLLAIIATLACALIGHRQARSATLLALNLFVLLTFTATPLSLAVLAAFLVLSFRIGLWRKSKGRTFSLSAQLGLVAALWAVLFVLRDGLLIGGGLTADGAVLPSPVFIIGLSYMVFRSISFIMEVEFVEHPGFLRYAAYIMFFPTLLAGPIERYRTFDRQLLTPSYDPSQVLPALHRIANGLIKKFVIADNLAAFGVFNFSDPMSMSAPMLWVGALSQLGLIYLDFSGYCDIVIGVAALLGFRVVENFNKPFMSTSVQEFWSRWHISLSTLVKDYIFTPVNILIIKNVRRNLQFLLITVTYFMSMILIALWHGLSWGFVTFGAVHGATLVIHQMVPKRPASAGPQAVQLLWTKRFLVYAFVSTSLILWVKTYAEWSAIFLKMLGLK